MSYIQDNNPLQLEPPVGIENSVIDLESAYGSEDDYPSTNYANEIGMLVLTSMRRKFMIHFAIIWLILIVKEKMLGVFLTVSL